MKYVKENMMMYSRIFMLVVIDAIFVVLSSFLTLYIRMEMVIDWIFWENYLSVLPYDIIITLVVFHFYNLYKSLWRFASMNELRRMISAVFVSSIIKLFLFVGIIQILLPRSWYILDPVAILIFCGGFRFFYRVRRSFRYNLQQQNKGLSHVMIIGAGEAGNILLREIYKSEFLKKRVVCLIDDDKMKKGHYMNGVLIVGGRDMIKESIKKYDVDEIYIALPSASAKERSEVIEICNETNCKLKILPGLYQMLNGEVSVSKLKDVEIEDLLGRDPIRVDLESIADYVRDNVIMVTGGGGSIGSELCRQIARHKPKQLIIVDVYENNAYEIQIELLEKYPELDLVVRIASVRDEYKLDNLFDTFRPDIVYHAAAHKHVPLMEDSPNEAVKNNVFGTYNVVKAADKYHVKRFVMISTDKAVNPTNIMGATKRICEMIIQAYNRRSDTVYTAVRFGNVLGSNGSVIPLFKKQIAHGGPVTVTHKDIIRYFMTIPEAVSLVIQAGVYAKGGDIFVLDMGKPVKIDDLARNLIKFSGLVPDKDIPIVYTGLRPGEKLYEELLMNEEGLTKTENSLVFIGHPIALDDDKFFDQLEELKEYVYKEDDQAIKEHVHEIVPTYHPWFNIK